MRSDKFYLVLAFLSFIVIAIVVVVNYNPHTSGTDYAGIYYKNVYYPNALDEKSIYSALAGDVSPAKCHQIDLEKTETGMIYLNFAGTKYKKAVYFVTNNGISGYKNDVTSASDDWTSLSALCGLTNEGWAKAKGETLFWTPINNTEYTEIIAPFNFSFGSVNTSDSTSMIIYDMSNTTKITFTGLQNWYCAGAISDGDDWIYHGGDKSSEHTEEFKHDTIIGNSNNAKIKYGSAGSVIAYANAVTKVKIEIMNNSVWKTISIKDWLTTN